MIRENVGWVAPKPYLVLMEPWQLAECERAAQDISAYRQDSRQQTRYKRGLRPNARLWGLLGEQTLVNFLNHHLRTKLQVNFSRLPYGDGDLDVSLYGLVIQVKNRLGKSDLLVRRQDELGRIIDLKANLYVKVSCPKAGGKLNRGGQTEATVDGWCSRERLEHFGLKPARMGEHMNCECADRYTEPAMELIDHLRTWKWEHERITDSLPRQ